MANYTLTTNPAQEAVLTWITNTYNQEHDTKLTNQDYIGLRMPQLLSPYADAYHTALDTAIKSKFATADPGVQAQVVALLGAVP